MALGLDFFANITMAGAVGDLLAPANSVCIKRMLVSNPTGGAVTVNFYTNRAAAGDLQFGSKDYSLPSNESIDWGIVILKKW